MIIFVLLVPDFERSRGVSSLLQGWGAIYGNFRRGCASYKAMYQSDGVACAKISAKPSNVKSFFEVRCNLVQTGKSLPAPVYMQRIAMSSVFAGFAQIMLYCVSLG